MPKKQSIFYDTLLLSGVSLLLRGISTVFQVWMSNRIGAAGIGLFQLTATVFGFAMIVGNGGVRIAVMYMTAEERGLRRYGAIRQKVHCCLLYGLLLSAATAAILFLTAGGIAQHWLSDSRAAPSLRIFALFLPITCLTSVMTGYYTAMNQIRRLAAVEVAEQLLSIALTVGLLLFWAGEDLTRACCCIVLASGLSSTFSLFCLLRGYRKAQHKNPCTFRSRQTWQQLLKLSIPLALSDCLRSGLSTVEHLLIPRGLAKSGSSYEDSIAAYGAIHGMVFPVILFPAAFLYALSDLLVPELSRCHAAKSIRRIRYLTGRSLKMTLLFGCAVSGLLVFLAPGLGQWLYKSPAACRYIRLFAPLVVVLYLDTVTDGMLKGLGQQLYTIRINTITSALDVIGLLLFLPRFGIAGYFWCFTITHIINYFFSLSRLLFVTGCRIHLSFCLRALLCTFLCTAAACRFLPLTGCPAAIAVPVSLCFLAFLVAAFFLTGVLSRPDLRWLRQLISPPAGRTPQH